MPWIDGRAIGYCLIGISGMPYKIVKLSIRRRSSYVDFANCIAHTIATIRPIMRVAGVRGLGHPNAQIAHRNRIRVEIEQSFSFRSVADCATVKRDPRALRRLLDRTLIARPVLYEIAARI